MEQVPVLGPKLGSKSPFFSDNAQIHSVLSRRIFGFTHRHQVVHKKTTYVTNSESFQFKNPSFGAETGVKMLIFSQIMHHKKCGFTPRY